MNRLYTIVFDNGEIFRSWNPNNVKLKKIRMKKQGVNVIKEYAE